MSVRSCAEFALHLSHALSLIRSCRTGVVRLDVDQVLGGSASHSIDAMTAELQTIRKYLDGTIAVQRRHDR